MVNWMMDWFSRWMQPPRLIVPPLETAAPGEPAKAAAPLAAEDLRRASNLIGQVSDLTADVASDVGDHQSQIRDLSAELAGVARGDAAAVAAVVYKLLAANQDLESRLERAELKLQAHSRQLRDVALASRTDPLTGLMNRRALDEELRRAQAEFHRRGRPASLLLLDVDHFKRFNDTHGHVAGDEALQYVADVLRTHCRETDIVARFGGEEFAVLFAATSAAAVRQRAERVRAAIGNGTLRVEGRLLRVAASAGLAETADEHDILQWLKRADAALYSAKRDGRNCAFWSGPAGLERIAPAAGGPELDDLLADDEWSPRLARECSAEIAAEAFADTTFVRQVGRRIAEWRRGGATFTVILCRLNGAADEGENSSRHQALRAAVALARACIREMDVLTLWTGDGLAMLLPGAGVADARIVARRLHAAVAKHAAAADGEGRLSVAIGIAEGIEGNDADRVLQRAWLALSAAQSAGAAATFVHDGLKTVAAGAQAPARG